MTEAAIPITVITGFLGSGKTTVLNRLLRQPELAGAVVIVNEFGEVGLDHLLIEASDEQFALLDNGCICCTVRGDLIATLKDIHARSAAGAISPVRRVLIETTGLADPAPILHTLLVEPELSALYRVGGVVATVDAVNGLATLERHVEAAKQVAVADRLLVTKTDIATAQAVDRLERRLAELAPTAERVAVSHGRVEASDILDIVFFDAAATPAEIANWIDAAVSATSLSHHQHGHACGPDCGHDHHHEHESHRHHGIQSYSFVIDEPVEWTAFTRWLDYLAALKGEDMLRLKGLVQVSDDPDRPFVLHGVQHVFHPPVRLEAWPSADRRTRLVFIVRDIPRQTIERTLARFIHIDAGRIQRPVERIVA